MISASDPVGGGRVVHERLARHQRQPPAGEGLQPALPGVPAAGPERRHGEAARVEQDLLDGDLLLAVGGEGRDVLRDRPGEVEHPLADELPGGRADQRLGAVKGTNRVAGAAPKVSSRTTSPSRPMATWTAGSRPSSTSRRARASRPDPFAVRLRRDGPHVGLLGHRVAVGPERRAAAWVRTKPPEGGRARVGRPRRLGNDGAGRGAGRAAELPDRHPRQRVALSPGWRCPTYHPGRPAVSQPAGTSDLAAVAVGRPTPAPAWKLPAMP